jgi:biotin operon repressor
MMDVRPLFKALADESRIRVVALLSARPLSVEEVAAATGLKPPTVSHHLAVLREAGLVQATREQYYTVYRFRPQPLLDALRAVSEPAAPPRLDEDLAQYDRKVLADYLEDGRLKTIPVQRKKRDVVLRYLAQQFEPGRRFTEREVNQILVAYHDDVATLRRELVSGPTPPLRRESGEYWRETQ